MKMMMFLLVSALALLLSPAVASPTTHKPEENLNHIIDLAAKYNKSLHEEYFVEDVTDLVEGEKKCEDVFFCKVFSILHNHTHFGKKKEEKELVRNLKMVINKNCDALLKEVTSTGVSKPLPKLVENLTICIQHRNLTGGKKSSA